MFEKLYQNCKTAGVLDAGHEALSSCIASHTQDDFTINEMTVGYFVKIKGYEVKVGNDLGFFPINLEHTNNYMHINWLREIFCEVDLVVPPFYQNEFLSEFANKVKLANTLQDKNIVTKKHLESMYTPDSIAMNCTTKYNKNKIISQNYYDQIIQSIKAYYGGLYKPAIIALIPCLEHIMGNLGNLVNMPLNSHVTNNYINKVMEAIQKKYIDKIFSNFQWYPENELTPEFFDKYDERIQMINSVIYFVNNSIYMHTNNVAPEQIKRINRHVIMHALLPGKIDDVEPCDFLRFITFLNALIFCSLFCGESGSILHSEETVESKSLATQFAYFHS